MTEGMGTPLRYDAWDAYVRETPGMTHALANGLVVAAAEKYVGEVLDKEEFPVEGRVVEMVAAVFAESPQAQELGLQDPAPGWAEALAEEVKHNARMQLGLYFMGVREERERRRRRAEGERGGEEDHGDERG